MTLDEKLRLAYLNVLLGTPLTGFIAEIKQAFLDSLPEQLLDTGELLWQRDYCEGYNTALSYVEENLSK